MLFYQRVYTLESPLFPRSHPPRLPGALPRLPVRSRHRRGCVLEPGDHGAKPCGTGEAQWQQGAMPGDGMLGAESTGKLS